jgi:hypothetical protein
VAASAVIALVALALIRVPAGTVTEPSDVA